MALYLSYTLSQSYIPHTLLSTTKHKPTTNAYLKSFLYQKTI